MKVIDSMISLSGICSLRFRLDIHFLLKSPGIFSGCGLLVFHSHSPSEFKSLVRFCRRATVNLNSQYSYCRRDRFQSMFFNAKTGYGSRSTLAKQTKDFWLSPTCIFSANIAIVEVALTPIWDQSA